MHLFGYQPLVWWQIVSKRSVAQTVTNAAECQCFSLTTGWGIASLSVPVRYFLPPKGITRCKTVITRSVRIIKVHRERTFPCRPKLDCTDAGSTRKLCLPKQTTLQIGRSYKLGAKWLFYVHRAGRLSLRADRATNMHNTLVFALRSKRWKTVFCAAQWFTLEHTSRRPPYWSQKVSVFEKNDDHLSMHRP